MLYQLPILMMLVFCQQALAADTQPARSAEIMWMLNCQGCHRPDASGTGSEVPPMPGIVSRFLSVPGGREYLIRVPGVATAPLSDESIAVLVNWMLAKFDPKNIPGDFIPYTGEEVASLRQLGAYGTEAGAIRISLMKSFVPVAASNRKSFDTLVLAD
jgi:hypothetical protein